MAVSDLVLVCVSACCQAKWILADAEMESIQFVKYYLRI
jgi:hypothetical protein